MSQLDEHVLRRRRLAFWGLAYDGQLLLLEQDLLQLLWRTEIERSTGDIVRPGLELGHFLAELGALLSQHLSIHEYAALFHIEEHSHERLLDRLVYVSQRRDLFQLRPQRLVQLQRNVRILCGIGGGLFEIDLVEGQLFGTLAGDVLVVNRLFAQVLARNRVHVVSRGDAVEHVRLEHRVVRHACQPNVVAREDMRIVLEVVPDFFLALVLEPGFELCKHLLARQLLGRTGIIMSQRDIAGVPFRHCKGKSDHLGGHVVEAVGFSIERYDVGFVDLFEPAFEGLAVEYSFVLDCVAGFVSIGFGRAVAGFFVQLAQQRPQFIVAEELAQRIDVAFTRIQIVNANVEIDVGSDRRKFLRESQRVEVVAQAFADLALDLVTVLDNAVSAVVLVEPLGRSFRSYLGHARNIVRAVAHQREVVDDLLGKDVELIFDGIAIHAGIGHRVDEHYLVRDQLRQVLVARRHQHLQALLSGLCAQRADDIIRLDAFDTQQRQAHCFHGIEDGLHLGTQFVGHRRACCLVVRVQIVAEGFARRIEYDGNVRGAFFAHEFADHRQNTVQGAGWLALRIAQGGQRVEGTVKVRRPVNQDEVSHACGLIFVVAVLVGAFFFSGFFRGGWRLLDPTRVARYVERSALPAGGNEHEDGQRREKSFHCIDPYQWT